MEGALVSRGNLSYRSKMLILGSLVGGRWVFLLTHSKGFLLVYQDASSDTDLGK